MGVLDIVPAGVLTGDNVRKLFEYAREHQFAIPVSTFSEMTPVC